MMGFGVREREREEDKDFEESWYVLFMMLKKRYHCGKFELIQC